MLLFCVIGLIVSVICIRLSMILPLYRKPKYNVNGSKNVSTMIYFGSGGHTTEMMRTIRELSLNYAPLYFVLGHSDTTSKQLIEKSTFKYQHNRSWYNVYRSREVKQSILTTIFTSIRSLLTCFLLVFKLKPSLIICNGPGTCIFICYTAFLLHFLGIKESRIIFIESFCRVKKLSVSGLLIYPIADKFIVQWPNLCRKYKKAEYIGKIC